MLYVLDDCLGGNVFDLVLFSRDCVRTHTRACLQCVCVIDSCGLLFGAGS